VGSDLLVIAYESEERRSKRIDSDENETKQRNEEENTALRRARSVGGGRRGMEGIERLCGSCAKCIDGALGARWSEVESLEVG
jgi:hypothetical protein